MRSAWLLLLLPVAAAGRERPGPGRYALGGRAVYFVAADADEGTWNPGVQARYYPGGPWAVEGAADYQRHSFPDTTVHTAVAQLSALAYYGKGRLQGFGTAGMGFYASRVHGPDYRRNLGRFAPHAGLGAEFWATEDWSVDLAWRHVWLGHLESRREGSGERREFKRAGEMLSLGVNRRFGG